MTIRRSAATAVAGAVLVLSQAFVWAAPATAAGAAAEPAATEPVASAPWQAFPPVGTTVPQKAAGVAYEVTHWRLQNPGTAGFSHFVLEQFNTYANTWSVVYFGTGTSYQALLPTIQFTEFRLTAFDAGGSPGPTQYGQGFTPFVADDSDASDPYASPIVYSSGWRRVAASTAYGGSYLRSTRAGASFTFCGYFSKIALVAPRTTAAGTASVHVFGSTHSLSFRATSSRYREVVGRWSTVAVDGLPAGSGPTHCLTVTAQSSAPIFVDALVYNVPDIIE
jgi:hypothetical protein